MRIIGKTSSINVRKVLWACEEIGIADDRPELSPNPNGLVPVLVDGSFVAWESCKIPAFGALFQKCQAPRRPRLWLTNACPASSLYSTRTSPPLTR